MQYDNINTKNTNINTNESRHSEMGPARQNPIQRTVRTAHLIVLMTVYNYSNEHKTLLLFCNFAGVCNSFRTVLWIGFCLTGPISLCLDSFVFLSVLHCHAAYVLYYCNTVGWTWWDWSLILRTFCQCFDTVVWVIWPAKTCPQYDL